MKLFWFYTSLGINNDKLINICFAAESNDFNICNEMSKLKKIIILILKVAW